MSLYGYRDDGHNVSNPPPAHRRCDTPPVEAGWAACSEQLWVDLQRLPIVLCSFDMNVNPHANRQAPNLAHCPQLKEWAGLGGWGGGTKYLECYLGGPKANCPTTLVP